jgi:hypothetical protein
MNFLGFGKPKKYDGHSWDFVRYGCPDCKGHSYYEGPSGGMCLNICCVNPECRSAFNLMGINDLVERIGNSTFRSAFPNCPEESTAYLKAKDAKTT